MHGGGESDVLWGLREVDEDEDFFAVALAWVDVNAFGDGAEGCGDAAGFGHPFGGVEESGIVHPCADVGDAAFAYFAGDGGGLAVEPAVGFAVAHEDFGVG